MLASMVYGIRRVFGALGNLLRRAAPAPDYVLLELEGSYPPLRPPRRSYLMRRLRPSRVSLQEWGERFQRISADPRVRGVVLLLRPLDLAMSHLDDLREMIRGLRAAGKRVVAWSAGYDSVAYYLACAADEILLMPGGGMAPLGLQRHYVFLADALERAGLAADILAISPYKTAADAVTRAEMSAEAREMANWLLDAQYGELIAAIAAGRSIDTQAARALIDNTPCTDLRARQMGAVDTLVSEEALHAHLRQGAKPLRMAAWESARPALLRLPPQRPGRYVALLNVEGLIVGGHSQRPPIQPPLPIPLVSGPRAGDVSVVQAARRAAADGRAAAALLYVDSGGGSAAASEAMWAALAEVAVRKPLVVVMGAVTASGGYLVSTPARLIVAQPNTITGSIGVLGGKLVSGALYDRLLVHRETLSRGEHADLYGVDRRFSPEERRIVREGIEREYDLFLEHVSAGRRMTVEDVDRVGGGRVWTGRQALENGLVDELGGLEQGLARARQLAGLDPRAPARPVTTEGGTAPPLADAHAALNYLLEGARLLGRCGVWCLSGLLWEDGVRGG
ncbi:MAG: S49 family peptidase [Anaerolineae bacterium]